MYNNKKTLLDLQLDQACEQLHKLIKLGKVLPDYKQMWLDFAKTKKGGKK